MLTRNATPSVIVTGIFCSKIIPGTLLSTRSASVGSTDPKMKTKERLDNRIRLMKELFYDSSGMSL
jgi:hypothetical protein